MKVEFDQFAHLDSLLHRWNPKHKLMGLGSLIFAFALVEDLRLLPFMLMVAGGLYWLSKLPFSFLRSRLRYPSFFILGIVLSLPLLSGETVIWQWGVISFRQEGIMAALLVMGRFLSIVTLGLILLGTSPFLETVKAMRSLGLPIILADMMLLFYRYLIEVQTCLTTMLRAMRLRGFRHSARKPMPRSPFPYFPWDDLRQIAALSGTLLIRSYERSERVYQAMRLRGYSNRQLPQRGLVTALSLKAGVATTQVGSLGGLAGILLISVSFVVLNQL